MEESKKIVVLEDDRPSARLIANFLEKKGYKVLEAYEARFAIEMVLREKPDLLIADILLPDMNGSEAVKQLRSSDTMDDLKVLFLTSLLKKSVPTGQETCLKVEGCEYPAIGKPFDPDALGAIVDRMLASNN